jgi:hypothetical protein
MAMLPSIAIGVPFFRKFDLIDPNAQAFITAAGITDATQKAAINTLVLDLKDNSLWSLLYAFYPIVGGSATSHKFNLVNPLDTDAAYRLVFSGGITHNANGVTGNGTNGFANTYLNPNSFGIDSFCNFLYSRTDSNVNKYDMGCYSSATTPSNCQVQMQIRNANFMFGAINQDDPQAQANTDSRGFHAISRINGSQEIKNIRGTNTTYAKVSKAKPSLNQYLMALNFNGSGFGYSARNYAVFGQSQGLTTTQLNFLNTAIINFQTTLGRNV